MDFVLILIGFAVIATIFMNIMAMNIIRSSQIHEAKRKQKLIMLLWTIPMLGVFIVIKMINKDIRENQAKMEDEIAPAIREVADRLKDLDADISMGKFNGSSEAGPKSSNRIH